jgi:hypothetical protein
MQPLDPSKPRNNPLLVGLTTFIYSPKSILSKPGKAPSKNLSKQKN